MSFAAPGCRTGVGVVSGCWRQSDGLVGVHLEVAPLTQTHPNRASRTPRLHQTHGQKVSSCSVAPRGRASPRVCARVSDELRPGRRGGRVPERPRRGGDLTTRHCSASGKASRHSAVLNTFSSVFHQHARPRPLGSASDRSRVAGVGRAGRAASATGEPRIGVHLAAFARPVSTTTSRFSYVAGLCVAGTLPCGCATDSHGPRYARRRGRANAQRGLPSPSSARLLVSTPRLFVSFVSLASCLHSPSSARLSLLLVSFVIDSWALRHLLATALLDGVFNHQQLKSGRRWLVAKYATGSGCYIQLG